MSSTLVDQIRCNHEEIERLERLVVQDLQTQPSSSKDRLVQGHRVRNTIHSIMRTIEKLVETYEDKDGAREDEIAALGGRTATGVNVYCAFYDRLKEIREYHRKYPPGPLVDASADYEALLKAKPVISFSGEEGAGRYLDLHDMYNQYINSKFGDRVEYSVYLDVFSHPEKVPRRLKFSRQYMKYMEALLEYLVNFLQRTEPLQDLDRMLSKALGALGLKVGGTLQQRAERLFLTKHSPLEKLDKKHFAKPLHKGRQNGDAKATQEPDSAKQIALTEAKVKKLCNLLDEAIERTKQNIVKKQAMTYEEMEEERKGE
ncbi:hypothetical protein DY000_02000252 [Brassica cretica]|uniref:Uncharacterized protein n=1 Tax=Brassica cretica TaxID=69181 RepID=A0ABQ7BY00_BRACR|nr:hypothetical protein DY000_02000252 [Brassica cretica]